MPTPKPTAVKAIAPIPPQSLQDAVRQPVPATVPDTLPSPSVAPPAKPTPSKAVKPSQRLPAAPAAAPTRQPQENTDKKIARMLRANPAKPESSWPRETHTRCLEKEFELVEKNSPEPNSSLVFDEPLPPMDTLVAFTPLAAPATPLAAPATPSNSEPSLAGCV